MVKAEQRETMSKERKEEKARARKENGIQDAIVAVGCQGTPFPQLWGGVPVTGMPLVVVAYREDARSIRSGWAKVGRSEPNAGDGGQ